MGTAAWRAVALVLAGFIIGFGVGHWGIEPAGTERHTAEAARPEAGDTAFAGNALFTEDTLVLAQDSVAVDVPPPREEPPVPTGQPSLVREEPGTPMGSIWVRVRPYANASFYLNGRFVAEGNEFRDTLAAGSHRLRVAAQGYVSRDTTIVVVRGDNQINLRMQRQ